METDDIEKPPPIPPPLHLPSTSGTVPKTAKGTSNELPPTGQQNDKPKQDYLYTDKDEGPFRVYVELNDSDQQKSINKISVGRMLRKVFGITNHVTEIKNAGRKKVLVYTNTFTAANRLVQNNVVGSYGYKAYIAKHLVSVTGVIAGIPTDLSDEEIMQDLHSLVPVMEVYRFHRFVNNAKIPSTRVSVTFRASKLPELVKLFSCSIKVEPFYRKAFLCLNCLRYNHKAVNCRSSRRCHGCGERHESEEDYKGCSKPHRCIYCKKNHSTTDENCPERQRQNNIKSVMAHKALTFFEAKELYPIPTSNSFNALAAFIDEPKPGAEGDQDYASQVRKEVFKPAIKHRARDIRRKKPEPTKSDSEEEERKRIRKTPSNVNNGTALNNPQRVNEQEQWRKKLHDARSQQATTSQATINYAIQEALQRYYSAIIADCTLQGQARENLIETSKRYLSYDVIHKE